MPGGPTCCATAAPAAMPGSSISTGRPTPRSCCRSSASPWRRRWRRARSKWGARTCAISPIACRWRPARPPPCATCWIGSTIAWPGGAPPVTASTGGASSTSTSLSRCAWTNPPPSTRSMPCRFGFVPKGFWTACASITSMASPIRQPIAEPSASAWARMPILWSRRSCCAARRCPATGAATAPRATTS